MTSRVQPERVFVGWDAPLLPRAAAWLYHRADSRRDLSTASPAARVLRFDDLLLVVPAARAGRRLIELLAELVEDRHTGPWTPPRVLTPGAVPEALYEPVRPPVSDLGGVLTRYRLLQQAGTEKLEPLLGPSGPETISVDRCGRAALMGLAEDLAGLAATLAADGLSVAEVAHRCTQMADVPDELRWRAIADLQRDYEEALANENLADRHAERLAALREQRLRTEQQIVLIGANDLPGIVCRMLDTLMGGPDNEGQAIVTALIPAPESESSAFDRLGNLTSSAWSKRSTPISDAALRIVERPLDQAQEVLWSLGEVQHAPPLTPDDGGDTPTVVVQMSHPPDRITIGVGDERMGPLIQRTLTMAGLTARLATGRPLAGSAPMTLLAALGRFAVGRHLADFLALIRHPDVRRFAAVHGADIDASPWLGLLDRYATEHLQGRWTGAWLGDPQQRATLAETYDLTASLIDPGPADPVERPLCDWADSIAAVLTRIYAGRDLDRQSEADRILIDALSAAGDLLGDIRSLPAGLCPTLTLGEAMGLTSVLAGLRALPWPGGEAGVELLGWLELALDDGPKLIVTGFNEGFVPRAAGADALLPDGLRRRLGLSDDAWRYARDMFLLHVIVHSRPDAIFIAGRTDARGEPLKPSRLAMALQGRDLARRVADFYAMPIASESDAPKPPRHPRAAVLPVGRANTLLPTYPQPLGAPINSLAVTAFRHYLACPYRFYLTHVLKLRVVDDTPGEMDGLVFGTLGHAVLAWFGRSTLAASDDADAIAVALSGQLDREANQRFGPHPPPAVRVQIEQMRERLVTLAQRQAEQTRAGWRIVPELIEIPARATLTVDGRPFTITGRIDRVDRHPELGYRLLDYKFGDSGDKPEKTHRRGPAHDKEWIDLQLPLYRHLATGLGLDARRIALGYIVLPKKLTEVKLQLAPWTDDDLAAADTRAHEVIRAVRAERFWPPGEPLDPRYDDGLGGLCFDEYPRRGEAFAQAKAATEGAI